MRVVIHAAGRLADTVSRLADRASMILATLVLMLGIAIPTVVFGTAGTAQATASPTPMTAWYMYGTTTSALDSNAYNDGYTTAGEVTGAGDDEYLMLDFGEPLYFGSNTYGAYDFSDTSFTNPQILTALENAAHGVHDGYKTGNMTIVYGNSNYGLASLTSSEVYNVGKYQVLRASQLLTYQENHGYVDQGAAAGSDMEPSWSSFSLTEQLVNGATAEGGYLYLDYGSADGCPTSGDSGYCNNGWDVVDEIYVSWHGEAVPFPEIYSETMADQWNVIRTRAQADEDSYFFWGITGSPPVSTAKAEWVDLYDLDSGVLGNDIVCFGC